MQGLEDSREVLGHLGLSEYEARVYYSLIVEGASGARKLSLNCGVPRTKVYGTIQKLEERGLVYEIPEHPSRYAPTSPADAFQRYISHFKRETSRKVISLMECRELVLQLEEAYASSRSRVNPRRAEIWILKDGDEMVKRMEEVLLQADESVEIVTPSEGLAFLYKRAGDTLDKLLERGIKTRVYSPIGEDDGFLIRELRHVCKIEGVEAQFPILYVCADGELALLIQLNLYDVNTVGDGARALLYDDPDLCEMFLQLLVKPEHPLV